MDTTTESYGGLRINRQNDVMLVEASSNGAFDFIRRQKNGNNLTVVSTQAKSGTLAFLSDLAPLIEELDDRILRDGNPHRLALEWTKSGLKASVDNGDLGTIVFQQSLDNEVRTLNNQLNTKLNSSNLDAGQDFIRAYGTYIVGGGGTAGKNGTWVDNYFPRAFPNRCVAVIPVHLGTDPTTNIIIEHGSITNTGFRAQTNHRLNASIMFLAIGY